MRLYIIIKSVFTVLCLLQCTRGNAVPTVETKVSPVNSRIRSLASDRVHEFTHLFQQLTGTTEQSVGAYSRQRKAEAKAEMIQEQRKR